MLTKPNHCCMCIPVQLASALLAIVHMLIGSVLIIFSVVRGALANDPEFYIGLVVLLFHLFGFVVVSEGRNSSRIGIYFMGYVLVFLLLQANQLLVIVTYSIAMFSKECTGLRNPISEDAAIAQLCHNREESIKIFLLSVVLLIYTITTLLQVHFCFVVRAFFHESKVEEKARQEEENRYVEANGMSEEGRGRGAGGGFDCPQILISPPTIEL